MTEVLTENTAGPNEEVSRMRQFFRQLWADEAGQDATEYVLLVVLIALAITAGMTILAQGVNGAFGNAAAQVQAAGS